VKRIGTGHTTQYAKDNQELQFSPILMPANSDHGIVVLGISLEIRRAGSGSGNSSRERVYFADEA
jgi:hypothetical protein